MATTRPSRTSTTEERKIFLETTFYILGRQNKLELFECLFSGWNQESLKSLMWVVNTGSYRFRKIGLFFVENILFLSLIRRIYFG